MQSHTLYLTAEDVEAVNLSMGEIVEALFKLYKEKGQGQVEAPPKPGIHPKDDCSIRAMLAYIPSQGAAGMKWIAGYADNWSRGIPNINGLIILNDCDTGIPKAIMDCSWITAKRTGASTAVAAEYLAREDSKALGLIACGKQGVANIEALAGRYDFDVVKAYDINYERAQQFADEMQKELGLAIEAVEKLEEAVRDMDIVVSSGPIMHEPTPAIEENWLKPGSFSCPLDFDSYFQSDAFKKMGKLFTDDLYQLDYFRNCGFFQETPQPDFDLGHLAAERASGRESKDERTMSINLGIGMLDVAIGTLVHEKAEKMGLGTKLPR